MPLVGAHERGGPVHTLLAEPGTEAYGRYQAHQPVARGRRCHARPQGIGGRIRRDHAWDWREGLTSRHDPAPRLARTGLGCGGFVCRGAAMVGAGGGGRRPFLPLACGQPVHRVAAGSGEADNAKVRGDRDRCHGLWILTVVISGLRSAHCKARDENMSLYTVQRALLPSCRLTSGRVRRTG